MARRIFKTRWEPNAFVEIMRSPEVDREIQAIVDAGLRKARAEGRDEDYAGGIDTEGKRNRTRGWVATASIPAIRREAKRHTILRAFGGGAAE